MKLSKNAARQLECIVDDIRRAREYIEQPDLAIVRPCRIAMMPDNTFTRKSDDTVFGSFDKQIGSDIAGLAMAESRLRRFLDLHTKQ